MLQLHDVSLAFSGQEVLRGLSWGIRPEARIGLIGANGAGKTTLLRIIAGQEVPDDGRVDRGGQTVGYLEQNVQEVAPDRTVRAEALEAFRDVHQLQAREQHILEALDATDDHSSPAYRQHLHDLERVQAKLVAREAHTVPARTEAALTGLGFAPDALDRPLGDFSGGWRMRAILARLLLRRPDVLLLDEPTNHLDIDAIDWLEDYLHDYPGTVVLTSHDRYFLDRMVTSIAELARGHITPYDGNYSFYLKEREARRAQQQAAYENQQRKIKEIEEFIARFRYNASKAAQVQSRVKQLDRMERIKPPPPEADSLTLRFPEPPRAGQVVLELSAFSKAYGPTRVFEDAGPLRIARGERIALIGPNGAGKSTLARILRGSEPLEGTRTLGHRVQPAFFAQHQAEALDPQHTVLESLRAVARDRDTTELRTLLGAFLFSGDDVFKRVGVLSGGEKSRLALARTLSKGANLLILDEPTNHLDLPSKRVLIDALQHFGGTLVLVSHDRHFLDEVATTVWRVGNGHVETYPGTFSEYQWHREQQNGEAPAAEVDEPSVKEKQPPETNQCTNGPKTKAQKRREAEARARRYEALRASDDPYAALNPYQLREELEAKEAAILEKETEQERMETRLADPSLYDDPEAAQQLTHDYEALKEEIAALYDDWETLADHLTTREAA